MSEWVNLDVIDGVGPVAVKHRRPQEDEALLDHEAAVLSAIDDEGVVHLVERRGGTDPALITHYVGTHSLATAPAPELDDVLRIIASLVDTLAALHRIGIRHGAIEPSHVLLGPGRRPILCGFSAATLPATPVDEPPTPADDVAAVGQLMAGLVADHDGLEPIPGHRSILGSSWRGYRLRALLTLADHCQADEPAARPSAASLASTISDLTRPEDGPGGSGLELVVERAAAGRRWVQGVLSTWPRPRLAAGGGRWRLAATFVTVVLVLVLFGVRSLRSSSTEAAESTSPVTEGPTAPTSGLRGPATPRGIDGRSSEAVSDSLDTSGTPDASDTPGTSAPAPTTTAATGSALHRPGPLADCPTPPWPHGVDVDGDGCPDGTPSVAGSTVTVGDDRFELGRGGDRILVGDWDCDGLATAVVVRADPPALWHFPSWAPVDRTVTARLVTDRIDPTSVRAQRDERGCSRLTAVDVRSGDPTPVAVTP